MIYDWVGRLMYWIYQTISECHRQAMWPSSNHYGVSVPQFLHLTRQTLLRVLRQRPMRKKWQKKKEVTYIQGESPLDNLVTAFYKDKIEPQKGKWAPFSLPSTVVWLIFTFENFKNLQDEENIIF